MPFNKLTKLNPRTEITARNIFCTEVTTMGPFPFATPRRCRPRWPVSHSIECAHLCGWFLWLPLFCVGATLAAFSRFFFSFEAHGTAAAVLTPFSISIPLGLPCCSPSTLIGCGGGWAARQALRRRPCVPRPNWKLRLTITGTSNRAWGSHSRRHFDP